MTVNLTHPAEQLATLVSGVSDDMLDAPTPCANTSVRHLLAHVARLAEAFTGAADKVVGPTTARPPATMAELQLPEDWRTLIPERLSALARAWSEPAAWEGETRIAGMTMPGTDVGFVVNDELVLHGWDLAAATDQPYEVAEPNLDAAWVFVFGIPDDPDARRGMFGPRLPVADSAPLLDRVLAGAGRDPYWSPPAPDGFLTG
jgi:uncharacterized protein (TIGR03086 family)